MHNFIFRFKPNSAVLALSLLTIALLGFPLNSQAGGLINFSYWNWAEKMTLSNSTGEVETPANIAAIGIQYEKLLSTRTTGFKYSVTGLFGQGSGGSTSGQIVYFASFQPMYGLMAEYSFFNRVEKRIYLETGFFGLYRALSWPAANNTTATSGASFNYGGIANLRIRLSPSFDFCQSLGFMMAKATTIWSVGFGYRF